MPIPLEPGSKLARRCVNVRVAIATLFVLVLAFPRLARAAKVSGTLLNASGGPQPGEQIHFENQVSHDIFLIETGPGGGFSIDLPPGIYNLRTDRGGVVASAITVDQGEVALGTVKEPGPLSWLWFFRRQGVIRGLVGTPAPSTANIPSLEEAAENASTASAQGHSTPTTMQPSPAQASTQTSAASGK